MALWGRDDQAVTANSTTTVESTTGAPIGTYALVKGDQVTRVDGANAHFGNTSPGTRALVDSTMFGNVTIGAFIANLAVGVFGVDAAEAAITTGNLALTYVTSGGSGYGANAVVTLTLAAGTTNATAVNAFANVTAGSTTAGRITSLKIAQPGSTYAVAPTVAIAAPAASKAVVVTKTRNTFIVFSLRKGSVFNFSACDKNYIQEHRVFFIQKLLDFCYFLIQIELNFYFQIIFV